MLLAQAAPFGQLAEKAGEPGRHFAKSQVFDKADCIAQQAAHDVHHDRRDRRVGGQLAGEGRRVDEPDAGRHHGFDIGRGVRRVDVAGFEKAQVELAVVAGQINPQAAGTDHQYLVVRGLGRRQQIAFRQLTQREAIEQPGCRLGLRQGGKIGSGEMGVHDEAHARRVPEAKLLILIYCFLR